jgi:hypothetical protein
MTHSLDKVPFDAEAVGDAARLMALRIPCQMCRIKNMPGPGYNIKPDGGCRHREGLSAHEVLDRLDYAVNQSENSRELAQCVLNALSLGALDRFTEVEAELRFASVIKAFHEWEQTERTGQ